MLKNYFFERDKNGRLRMKTLDMQIFFDDVFSEAKNEEEIEWMLDNIQAVAETQSEEAMEYLD